MDKFYLKRFAQIHTCERAAKDTTLTNKIHNVWTGCKRYNTHKQFTKKPTVFSNEKHHVFKLFGYRKRGQGIPLKIENSLKKIWQPRKLTIQLYELKRAVKRWAIWKVIIPSFKKLSLVMHENFLRKTFTITLKYIMKFILVFPFSFQKWVTTKNLCLCC